MSNEDLNMLQELADAGDPWSDAIQAYLDALEEVA